MSKEKRELKKGITYISDRGSQLRYSDNNNKEQWIQQVSRYKALEKIMRGQAVSVASNEDFEEIKKLNTLSEDLLNEFANDPEPYVVLTNTKKHLKCIGLALEPAEAGEEIHILPFGNFTFDTVYEDAHNVDGNTLEYNPGFTYDDVGKRVYVKFCNEDNVEDKGCLTVNEEETLKYYQNIICVGYLVDAPRKGAKGKTIIEISIQGDYRGPVDNTQFEGILGEDVTISEKDPIRLFAVGKESDEKFKSILRLTPQGGDFTDNDFIAVQKLDGRTAFIYPEGKNFTGDYTTAVNDNDKRFLYMSKVYRDNNTDIDKENGFIATPLEDTETVESARKNIDNLKAALNAAFKFVMKSESEAEVLTINSHIAKEPLKDEYFGYMEIQANDIGGYYEIYISSGMIDRFSGSATLSHGSFENKGKAVLADIRIPTRREIIGVYKGNTFGNLKKGDPLIFMRMGEYEIPAAALDEKEVLEDRKFFGIGNEYYLGYNGRLSKVIYKHFDYINKVAFQKDENKLIFDIGSSAKYYDGSLPIGYMKPSVAGQAEYGFLLMDGVTEYLKNDYLELYNRLLGWFPTERVEVSETHFKVPKVVRPLSNEAEGGMKEVYMQIKYIASGIYEFLPKFPFIRSNGQFEPELDEQGKITKPNISNKIDVTSLVEVGIEEEGILNPDISNLDIHLYVDPNKDYVDGPHNWVEVRDGYFNYNNTTTYGYNWVISADTKKSDYNPYGSFYLNTDIGNGEGIAYINGTNQAPVKLSGCHYKVYITRRETFNRQFDLDGLKDNYISNSVYTEGGEPVVNKAVSGKAVLDAIRNKKDIDSLQVNKGAAIELGTEENPVSKMSIVSTSAVPIVADRIEIANSFDTEELVEGLSVKKESKKLTFEGDKAYLKNADNENIYNINLSESKYSVNGEQVPTVSQVRQHAELTIDGSRLEEILSNRKDNKNGAIHGMVFGIDGNIDSSALEGLKLGLSSKNIITGESNLEGAYIPFIYKDKNSIYNQNIEGHLHYLTKGLDGNVNNILSSDVSKIDEVDRKFIYNNYTIEDTTSEGFAFNISNKTQVGDNFKFSQEFNFKSGEIGFYKIAKDGLKAAANIIAGNIQSGSRSEYKRIYGEKRRSDLYVNIDGIETPIPWTDLDEGSIHYTDGDETIESTNTFTNLLGSALQAAYELPMAYWQYRTEEDWYKKSMGVIVERVEDVAKEFNDTMKRKLFDNIEGSDFEYPDGEGRVNNHNEFKYDSKEVESIKTYLSDIINNSSTGVNITDAVGLLLKAAQETQERLLKVETSTFGDDYETIPGERTHYNLEGLDPTVTHNPTNLGLNRLIRAICLEIYQTANPFDSSDFDVEGGGTPILSRVDRLDIDIHGKLNEIGIDSKTAENELSSFDSTTYPYDDVVNSTEIKDIRKSESTSEEQEIIAKEAGTKVETRQNMKSPKPIANTNNSFNGVVDAIYRITTKLNALTESVNGEDNIANAPLRLNTIRQNIEHIIRESYLDDKNIIKEVGKPVESVDGNGTPIYTRNFETEEAIPYVDTNDKLNTPFIKDNSRFDRLTKALYDFTISRENASQEFGTFKEFGGELQENTETPVYYTGRQFNGKSLLTDSNATGDTANDIKSHVPQNLNDYNYATLLDIVVDAIGDQFYRNNTLRVEGSTDAAFAKEISRHNKTISSRLDEIETALDKVVFKLSRRHHFEVDTGELKPDSFSIEVYTRFLNEYLGYSHVDITDTGNDNDPSSYKESWVDGIDSEVTDNKYSAEFAISNKKNIQAGLINTLYRLQKEEATSEKYDSILGDEFNSNSTSITQSVNEEGIGEDSYQKNYVTSSTYTLTDDIKDILKTIYGKDSDSPKDIENPKDDTLYTHRTLVNSNKKEDRFVNNIEDDNIIDKMINESYYLPQPVRQVTNTDAGYTDGSSSNLMFIERGDDKDSRYANFYDFDANSNVYDIKDEEYALSNNNRKEFFNQIGRNKDDLKRGMHERNSRFQVIENEIRSERKLLGNNLSLDEYNNNPDAIELKFNGKLVLDSDLRNFKGINFNNIETIDADTDQYNKADKPTSILEFALGTDKSTRDIRNELGIKKTEEGSNKYYDSNSHSIKEQGEGNKKTVYTRVFNIEKDLVKFTTNTDSLLSWS